MKQNNDCCPDVRRGRSAVGAEPEDRGLRVDHVLDVRRKWEVMAEKKPPQRPSRRDTVPIKPPNKYCPECGWEVGTGHSDTCSRR